MSTSYRRTLNLARAMLGPTARVLNRGGEVYIVTESHGVRTVFGVGSDYVRAAANAFLENNGQGTLVDSAVPNSVPTISSDPIEDSSASG